MSQGQILDVLKKQKREMTYAEIQKHVKLSSGAVQKNLLALFKGGFVSRKRKMSKCDGNHPFVYHYKLREGPVVHNFHGE